MEKISLMNALDIGGHTTLEDLRKKYNLSIPDEYLESSKNLASALFIYGIIGGMFLGMSIVFAFYK